MEENNPAGGGVVLDIGRCFKDAVEVYKPNVLILVLATFLLSAMSLITLFILMAPLYGGYFYMMLKAAERDDKKVELQDMFSMFKLFWPLFGLFWLQGLLVLGGSLLFIIPGIFLATVWMFSMLVMVDKSEGVLSSLRISWHIVMRNGFWMNFALIVIYIAFSVIPSYIPFVGFFAAFLVSPFTALLLISAYIQQVSKEAAAA